MSSWQMPPNVASQADQPPTNATSGTENMETTFYQSSSPDHKLIPPYLTPSSSSGGFSNETGQYGAQLPSPSTYGNLPFQFISYSTPAPSSSRFTTPPNTAGHPTSWPIESPNPNFVSGYDGQGFSTDETAMYPAPAMARNNFDNLGSATGISSAENPFGIYDMSEQFNPYRSNSTAMRRYSPNMMYPSFPPSDLSESFQPVESNGPVPQYQAVPPQQEDHITTTMPLQSDPAQWGYPITTSPDFSASFQTVLPPHQALPLQQEDRTSAMPPNLLPTPSSHRTLAPKRRRGEEGQEESASNPVPKRGRRTPPGPEVLNDKEQLLMNLKEGNELSWKQIAAQYSSSTGKQYSDAALQMKQRRVKERLQEWTDADSRGLRLAIDDYLAKNNNEMPRGNRQWTIVIDSMRGYGSTYTWSAEMCQKRLKKMDKRQEISSQQQPATSSAQPNQMPQQAMSTPSVSQYSSPETGAYFYYMPQ